MEDCSRCGTRYLTERWSKEEAKNLLYQMVERKGEWLENRIGMIVELDTLESCHEGDVRAVYVQISNEEVRWYDREMFEQFFTPIPTR